MDLNAGIGRISRLSDFRLALAGLLVVLSSWACNSASTARGAVGALSANPATLDFGTVAPNVYSQKRVTVSNTGAVALNLRTIKVVDDAAGAFIVSTAAPVILPASGTLDVEVAFTGPADAGSFSGFLEIDSDAGNAPVLLVRLLGSVGGSCDGVTCPANASCAVTANGPTCTCNDGYVQQADGCVLRDPCAQNNGGCGPNTTCTSASGTVVCTCKPGYQGNGETGSALVCTPTDPCVEHNGGCDPNATCAPRGDSVDCICNPGYEGNGATGTAVVCTPVNRCLTFNGGCDPNAICTPHGVDVSCECKPGYKGNGATDTTLVCVRENPCDINNGGCDVNATCTPSSDGVICTCNVGYEGNGADGTALVCKLIDLCATNNGGCDPNAKCTQHGLSVDCQCNQGYKGNGQTGTALTCTLIDQCLVNNGGCDPHAYCYPQNSSVYCACMLGYQGNGRTGTDLACTPINLCLVENGGCDPNAICIPDGTSVDCICRDGFMGNGKTGTELVCTGVPGGGGGMVDMPPVPLAQAGPPSMRSDHACDVASDGSLWCWGANSFGQVGNGSLSDAHIPVPVSANATWKAVATGDAHTCGIQTDGSLWCWGDNSHAELATGHAGTWVTEPMSVATGTIWKAISAGSNFSCGIQTDGSLWCWGDNRHGQTGVPPVLGPNVGIPGPLPAANGQTWIQVSCGTDFACGVQSDGSVWCWGSNASGALGIGGTSTTDVNVPTQVGSDQYVTISAGVSSACGIRVDGSLWCWGSNLLDTFGTGSSTGRDMSPVQIGTGKNWTSIAVSVDACATDTDNWLWCTGPNDYGNLGTGNQTSHMSLVHVATMDLWLAVAVGNRTTCALNRNNGLFCWGSDDRGQLGDKAPAADSPTQVEPGKTWKSVALGHVRQGNIQIGGMTAEWSMGDWSAAYAVRSDGTLWEWGGYAPYNLALWERQGYAPYDAAQLMSQVPTRLGSGMNWVSVSAGDPLACALDAAGNLSCFGSTNVGDGTTDPSASPVPVGTGPWVSSSVGSSSACATRKDGQLWCWGDNGQGVFGNGTITGAKAPESVATGGLTDAVWSSVSLAATHACGINVGWLFCWGNNSTGALGNGSIFSTSSPQSVIGTPWSSVSAGFSHTCALQPNNSLWCWGQNAAGEVGIGTQAYTSTPSQVPGLWSSVVTSTTSATTCGIKSDGSLWCWGSLAPIGSSAEPVPTRLGADSSWKAVAVTGMATSSNGVASDVEVCAIKSDDTLWCWGANTFGQRGNGQAWALVPIYVF